MTAASCDIRKVGSVQKLKQRIAHPQWNVCQRDGYRRKLKELPVAKPGTVWGKK